MTEPAPVRASVFAKLLAIMLTMAVSLLVLVSAFFMWIIVPALNRSLAPFVDDYVQKIADTQPSFDEATRFSRRFDLDIRYEGPGGTWSTSASMPPIARTQLTGGHWLLGGNAYHLATAPNGGRYLFRWTFRRKTIGAHTALLVSLLALMGGTIIVAHMIIRRLLRPLRTLGAGVARLSSGDLDVVLPAPTRDEFGALTDAFNEMVGRVRDMIRARDQLLLDVSHELRSPLTRMRVAIELLPDRPDRANMIEDVAEMEAMLAELLELERLRDGRTIHPVRRNLAPLVRDVVANFQDRPPGARIVSLPQEVSVEIDGEKIRTVLRNLIENAIKYSLPDSRAVEISVASDDRHVVIRVRDDGPGIPEADLPTIFEPFFRVNRARSKAPAGYGLGLSICKRIVEAHGGTIEAENHSRSAGVARGATFFVTLPNNFASPA